MRSTIGFEFQNSNECKEELMRIWSKYSIKYPIYQIPIQLEFQSNMILTIRTALH